ncbi:hypothetical protein [Amycolatopsis plumensis]|uniref:hypothetical protein n=1 Tax=Amycolatopsis plumensis TaxID=236508 RepID=UPI00361B0FE5
MTRTGFPAAQADRGSMAPHTRRRLSPDQPSLSDGERLSWKEARRRGFVTRTEGELPEPVARQTRAAADTR